MVTVTICSAVPPLPSLTSSVKESVAVSPWASALLRLASSVYSYVPSGPTLTVPYRVTTLVPLSPVPRTSQVSASPSGSMASALPEAMGIPG